jgi:hypothetical protein
MCRLCCDDTQAYTDRGMQRSGRKTMSTAVFKLAFLFTVMAIGVRVVLEDVWFKCYTRLLTERAYGNLRSRCCVLNRR